MNEIPMELRVLMEVLEAQNEKLVKENEELKALNEHYENDSRMLQEIADSLEEEVADLEAWVADLTFALENNQSITINEVNSESSNLIEMEQADGTIMRMTYEDLQKFLKDFGGNKGE